MDAVALLQKVRRIEIKTRRLSDQLFSGEYQSSFKGRGMSFAEVRPYQSGDIKPNTDIVQIATSQHIVYLIARMNTRDNYVILIFT